MFHFLYIILALLPSIIWLLFFLRKDVHPEPKSKIISIFVFGMLIALPAIFIERGMYDEIGRLNISESYILILQSFIAIALVEEVLKYLVVRERVISAPEFDEPVDLMLYMIIAALGFAAAENIFIFLRPNIFLEPFEPYLLSAARFLGATLLHALCSGLLGYFLALSFFETKHRLKLQSLGIIIVTGLHGLNNFSIIKGKPFVLPVVILIALTIFVFLGFSHLKKIKSVCKI